MRVRCGLWRTWWLGAAVATLASVAAAPSKAVAATTDPVAHWLDDLEEINVAPLPAYRRDAAGHRYVTLTIGGDLGFGGSRQPVASGAGVRHGRRYPHETLTRHLKPYLKSDLAFANLETVVTSTNNLAAYDKTFNFRMHPDGLAHLVKFGFNVLSTANNHAIDYGRTGMRHTLKYMKQMQPKGLLAAHGIADTMDGILTPARFKRKGASFALSAVGIGGAPPSDSGPGQLHFRSPLTKVVVDNLGSADVDFRMLSVHYGAELQVRPSTADRTTLLDAIKEAGVDLVIGHHAHTPAGVERVGDGIVFYGLGNLLHLGMQTMDKFGICRDFGILAKLHLASRPGGDGRLVAQAIEIHTLSDMNAGARVRKGDNGRQRIEVLNYLGAELGKRGVQFQPRADGSGLYCAPGASDIAGPVGKLCRTWKAPDALSQATNRRLAAACRYRRKSVPMASDTPVLRKTLTASQKQRRRRRLMQQAFQSEN